VFIFVLCLFLFIFVLCLFVYNVQIKQTNINSPVDLQPVKASGVTFLASLLGIFETKMNKHEWKKKQTNMIQANNEWNKKWIKATNKTINNKQQQT